MEKVLILGLSKSGISAGELAIKLGYDTYISEYNSPKDEFKTKIDSLKKQGIHIEDLIAHIMD